MVHGPHVHSSREGAGVWLGNFPNAYGTENLYRAPSLGMCLRTRNGEMVEVQPPYQENGCVRLPIGVENQNSRVDSSPKMTAFEGGNLYRAPSLGMRLRTRNGEMVEVQPPYQENGCVRLPIGVENQNSRVDSSPKMTAFEGGVADHALYGMPSASNLEHQN
nr:hypothetical protein [Tanacetum cinerariifolium]